MTTISGDPARLEEYSQDMALRVATMADAAADGDEAISRFNAARPNDLGNAIPDIARLIEADLDLLAKIDRAPLGVTASDLDAPGLLAPFTASGGGWMNESATLIRIDLELPEVETVTMAVVDTGTYMAEVEGDAARGFQVRPSSPGPLFAALCGWQRALAGFAPPQPAPMSARSEDVSLPDGQRLRVAVGRDWETVAAPTPVWVAPAQEGFAPNVVVTAAPDPVPADAAALRADLARSLPALRVIDITRTSKGLRSTGVHPTNGRDAVTIQERHALGDTTVAVAYTCAVEQYPQWCAPFTAWLDELG